MDLVVLQSGEHGDGQESPLPVRDPRTGSRQARVHPPGDSRDGPQPIGAPRWVTPMDCSISPTGSCWSPAAAAALAARWPSPLLDAGPTWSLPAVSTNRAKRP